MAQPPEPKLLKEAVIQFMAEKHELWDSGFTAPNLSNAAYGFEFDPSALEDDGGFSAFASFDTIDLPYSATLARRQRNIAHLGQQIIPRLRDKELSDKVEKLLDDELREGCCPAHLWQGRTLVQKAFQLSSWRVEKGLLHPPKPVDYVENLKKYEFKVCLLSLHYGYSEIVNRAILFFAYDTPFHDFLSTLRNQTVLCVIPPRGSPIDTTLARSPSRESSCTMSIHESQDREMGNGDIATGEYMANGRTNISQQETLKVETSSAKAKRYQGGGKKLSNSENNIIPEETRRPRSPSEKGYTLNDGPWRYKINSAGNSYFTDITNEESYIAMLHSLRKLDDPKTLRSGRNMVVIMHSMDRIAWERWKSHQEADEKDKRRFREELARSPDADPKENDDEEWGELFSTWWLRNAQQGPNAKAPTKITTPYSSSDNSSSIIGTPSPPNDQSIPIATSNPTALSGTTDAIPQRVRSSLGPPLSSPVQPSDKSS